MEKKKRRKGRWRMQKKIASDEDQEQWSQPGSTVT
jgi:hypothetical protein